MLQFNFKPFSPDDWATYSGAEGEPEICETKVKLDGEEYFVVVVLDDNGINLDYVKDEYGGWLHDFYFDIEEGGKERARAVFNMLNIEDATVENLQAIGFHYNDLTENSRS